MLVVGDDSMTPDDSWNELQTVSMGPLPSDLNTLPRIPSPFGFSPSLNLHRGLRFLHVPADHHNSRTRQLRLI